MFSPTMNATNANVNVEVDARGLEPPQPMVRILEALGSLPPDAVLRARTDRRPLHLYPLLEDRGFVAETEPEADGSFVTHIRRGDGSAGASPHQPAGPAEASAHREASSPMQ